MTVKRLRYVPCRDRDGTVSKHSDWIRNVRALYDWFSRFSHCRSLNVPCVVIFHTQAKSTLSGVVVPYFAVTITGRCDWMKRTKKLQR
jgi:hypothetical protein